MLQVNGSSEWFSSNATAGRVPLASRYTLEERRASFNAGRARGGVAPMPPDAPWEQRYTPLPADAEGAAAEEGSGAADQVRRSALQRFRNFRCQPWSCLLIRPERQFCQTECYEVHCASMP